MSLRRPILAVLAIVVLAASQACSSSSESSDTPTQQAGIDASQPLGNLADAETDGQSGGTMSLGVDRDPNSFDPTVGGINYAAASVYGTLMRLDEKGDPQPDLAESMSSTDDGVTWLMKLRRETTFQDGTPFDAQAVVFNVKREIDDEAAVGHVHTQDISSVRAVDDMTVEFKLSSPVGAFPVLFALDFADGSLGFIASPTAIQKYGEDYGRHPVGAGPFKFVSWAPDSQLVLSRFDQYWQKGSPKLDQVVFKTIPDDNTRLAALKSGDLDGMVANTYSALEQSSADKAYNVFYGPGIAGTVVLLNNAAAPFDDPTMRQAAAYAINWDAINQAMFQGTATRSESIFAADSPYFNADAAKAWPKYDPDKAKELVQKYVDGGGSPDFVFDSSNTSAAVTLGELLQAQWEAVGLKVSVKTHDGTEFTTSTIKSDDLQAAGFNGKAAGNPYDVVYNSLDTDGARNYSNYSDPEVDTLLDDAISTTDQKKRIADYQQVQALVSKDVPLIWLNPTYTGVVTQSDVKGFARSVGRDLYLGQTYLSGK